MAFASQLRIATIILTGFSVVAALSTAVRIVRYARRYRGIESLGDSLEKGSGSLYPAGRNSYKGSDGDDRKWGWWKQWKIPPGEIYPLTLAIGIIVQGLMIVVEESTSTDRKGLNRKGIIGDCSVTSELTWAAMWITPYITLVFTAECLSRAISWPRFAARKKYAAPTCILTAALLVILTWIPSHTKAASQNDVCEGEFVTFLNHYANGGLAVFSVLLPVVIFVIVTIYMHLNKDVEIVPRERYSASKVVSYAALNVGQWILIMPFFATSSNIKINESCAFLATIVLNSSGIFLLALFFYLRSNEPKLSIRPISAHEPLISNNNTSFPSTPLPIKVPIRGPFGGNIPIPGFQIAPDQPTGFVRRDTEGERMTMAASTRGGRTSIRSFSMKTPSRPKHALIAPIRSMSQRQPAFYPRFGEGPGPASASLRRSPSRPSRDNTPQVNLDRRQDFKVSRPNCDSCTGTLEIHMDLDPPIFAQKTLVQSRRGAKGEKLPPPPMEKAEPPEWAREGSTKMKQRVEEGNAESLRSILKYNYR